MFKSLITYSMFFVCACNNKTDTYDKHKKIPVQWQQLTIEFNDTLIRLIKFIDTLEIITFTDRIQKFPINKAEKNSLFELTHELLNVMGRPKQFCTNYISRLNVRIRYNSQLKKEVTFSSLCDWRGLDSNSINIDKILRKIIENNETEPGHQIGLLR